MNVEFSRNKH